MVPNPNNEFQVLVNSDHPFYQFVYGDSEKDKKITAIMDAFSTGYVFKTPCDLIFFKNAQGIINVKVEETKYQDFCTQRPPMPQFEHPLGYYKHHFAWSADWGLELPEGYSALFMTPMNRFDLPFYTMSGIVAFFIAEGWEGTIPAGTPYLQVLPFKRENWEHEIEILDQSKIYDKMVKNMQFYRQPDGGVYKNKVWSRREYR